MNILLKIKKLYSNNTTASQFLIRGIIFYSVWYLFYDSGFFNVSVIDTILIDNLIKLTDNYFNLLGFETFRNENHFGIIDTSGVIIGPPCNALSLMALYSGFILSFPGKWKIKFLFVPMGILAIHILNLMRVISLVYIVLVNPEWLEFNHSYTFTLIVYSSIFLLWMFWINRYTRKRGTVDKK